MANTSSADHPEKADSLPQHEEVDSDWSAHSMSESEPDEVRKAVVVLGKRLKDDGSPTAALVSRVARACTTFKEYCGPRDYMMFTGGKPGGVPRSEAEVMRDIAIGKEFGMSDTIDFDGEKVDVDFGGVTPEQCILEDKARTTVENAFLIRERMRMKGVHEAIIVTCDFHMRRAFHIFEYVFGYKLHKAEYRGLSSVLAPVLNGRSLKIRIHVSLPCKVEYVCNCCPIPHAIREAENAFEATLPNEKMEGIIKSVLSGVPETVGNNAADKLHKRHYNGWIKAKSISAMEGLLVHAHHLEEEKSHHLQEEKDKHEKTEEKDEKA